MRVPKIAKCSMVLLSLLVPAQNVAGTRIARNLPRHTELISKNGAQALKTLAQSSVQVLTKEVPNNMRSSLPYLYADWVTRPCVFSIGKDTINIAISETVNKRFNDIIKSLKTKPNMVHLFDSLLTSENPVKALNNLENRGFEYINRNRTVMSSGCNNRAMINTSDNMAFIVNECSGNTKCAWENFILSMDYADKGVKPQKGSIIEFFKNGIYEYSFTRHCNTYQLNNVQYQPYRSDFRLYANDTTKSLPDNLSL